MFASFSEAASYLKDNINTYDPNNTIDDEEARDMLFEAVFSDINDEDLDQRISESDKMVLQGDDVDEGLVISILSNSIPNFYTLLTDAVAEIMNEYMNEEEDLS